MIVDRADTLVSPLKRRLLFESVAEKLESLILSGELKPGVKLPSEHELARQFNVSRNVVREGLRSLIEQGLITVRPGDGVYVQTPDQSVVIEAFSRYMQLNRAENWVDELYEVRRLLEPEIAALAAQRATPEDLSALEEALERMRIHQDDPEEWAQADWDFHSALARASHNSLLLILLKPLHRQLLRAFAEGWHHSKPFESRLRFHAEIIDPIRTRDPQAAREAVQALLAFSYMEVTESLRQRAAREEKLSV